MWESVAGAGGLLERIDGFSHDKPSAADQGSGKVSPFKMADSHTRARSGRSDDDRWSRQSARAKSLARSCVTPARAMLAVRAE